MHTFIVFFSQCLTHVDTHLHMHRKADYIDELHVANVTSITVKTSNNTSKVMNRTQECILQQYINMCKVSAINLEIMHILLCHYAMNIIIV